MTSEGRLFVGTSGWNYGHWKGGFYPDKIDAGKMLAFYATKFGTVEVNNTFYGMPRRETVQKWFETVPEDFVFSVKANRYITHRKRLKDIDAYALRFLETIGSFRHKLGPVLFQLPPTFKRDAERLYSFMQKLPQDGTRYVFEFRNESWFEGEVYKALSERSAGFCVYNLSGKTSPLELTSDFGYVRLHGPKEPYRGGYAPKLLKKWAETFRSWLKDGKDVYVYFDNDEKAFAARDALRTKELMQAPSRRKEAALRRSRA